MNAPDPGARRRAGIAATLLVLALYGGLGLFMDPVEVRRTPADPTAPPGFQSDEASYYLMGHSLATDFDLEYRQEDVLRARREFPQGPSGVFLKPGRVAGAPDPDTSRLFFGKSFAYPLFAAPFVKMFGTRGFYLFNGALLALAFFCAYMFLSARSSVGVSLILAGGFLFPTIVPVYWAWITPELFNCVLGLVAYFCWLYKFVAPTASSRRTEWLRGPASDVVAAVIIGILAFSKPSNALLGAPIGLWWLWNRDWARAAAIAAGFALFFSLGWGANRVISGDWNYQGGLGRIACQRGFPFETPGVGIEALLQDKSCLETGTSKALTSVWFDQQMFWHNMRANLGYFWIGRYAGVVAYFFPFAFALVALLAKGRRREAWQWFVLASIALQVLVFLITLPYTWMGGGGSVGNRYFMGLYGAALFLLPPIQSVMASFVPWLVGGVFMAPLVVSPFDTSVRPDARAFGGPLRLLPVELTNYNDLPVMTERALMSRRFGVKEGHQSFELTYLDKNSWLKEADGLSFWTRGESRAELLVRTNEPERRLHLMLYSDVPVTVDLELEGRRTRISLLAAQHAAVQFGLPPGFAFSNVENQTSYIWRLAITTNTGFTPPESPAHDNRFLGVRVLPLIIR